jgi:DNA-binding CsgD family transcriptional regulator
MSRNNNANAASLTIREREILTWAKQGKNTSEIASILVISQHTVKYHFRNIFLKLNVDNRAQAVVLAMENKLIV